MDFDLYQEYEEMDEDPFYFDDVYKDREYDFLNADPEAISEYSGVCKKSIPSAFQALTENCFIEPIGMVDGRETWKLFTQPQNTYTTYMNEQARKRYKLDEIFTY